MRGGMARTGAAVAVLLAFVAVPSVAEAGRPECLGYPEPTLSPTSGPVGTVVTIEADDDDSGCVPRPMPGEGVDAFVTVGFQPLTPRAEALAVGAIDDDGGWSTTWTVPQDRPLGGVTLYATAWSSYDQPAQVTVVSEVFEFPAVAYAGLTFTVTGAPTTTSSVTTSVPTTATTTLPTTTDPTSTSSTATPEEPWMEVSDRDLLQGQSFEVTGGGFAPGTPVEIWIESTPYLMGTAVADAVGRVQATVVVPADWPTGPHTVRLVGTGVGGNVVNLTVGVTVGSVVGRATATSPTSAAVTPTTGRPVTGALPRTGGGPLGPVGVALALVALGAAGLVARRRGGALGRRA